MFKSTVRLCLKALCNYTPPRSFVLALCLLIPLALLAASCGSNSDSTTPEDPDSRTPVTTTTEVGGSSDGTTPETSLPLSTTSVQSEPLSSNITENSNSGALPAANQQSQTNQSDATAISAGRYYSCALHQTGQISCWGNNAYGQLGNGTGGKEDDYSSVPVGVIGISDATAISAGGYHSCALHQNSNISCWGNNSRGRLGDGRGGSGDDYRPVPVSVMGISDATAISAGGEHSYALHQTGQISCWGYNGERQLGDGTVGNEDDYSPVPVGVVGISDAIAVSAGWDHSCALHQTGQISCWGSNAYGRLGNGTEEPSSVPVAVEGIDDATAISASASHSCALHQNSTISCWGDNYYGQLGNGTGDNREDKSLIPVKVKGIDDATAISASSIHSCALHQTGQISCWGLNSEGQLGDSTWISRPNDFSSVPVRVDGIDDAIAVSASWTHSCALHQNSNISCWGSNEAGQLGNGKVGDEDHYRLVPVGVVRISDAIAVSSGSGHSCALHRTGSISCWGGNRARYLDDGTEKVIVIDFSPVPVGVKDISDAIFITTGSGHSCALHQNSTISCWGLNSQGQLGDGTGGKEDDYSSVPVSVIGISDAIVVSSGEGHSCALHQTGDISCWGNNSQGRLGDGRGGSGDDYRLVPVSVVGISDAVAISAGGNHSCALHQTGDISCWGDNNQGQLGDGTGGKENDYSPLPVRVNGIDDAIAVSAGDSHSCALHQDSAISCWGGNWTGQLGDGTGDNPEDKSLIPVKVKGIDDAIAVSASLWHSCALHQNSTISCWGLNSQGQLGDGTGGESLVPVKVENIDDAIAISTAISHSCALHQTGTISCWGNNWIGALGDGSFLPKFVVGFGG